MEMVLSDSVRKFFRDTKNSVNRYSAIQILVREATSNASCGPSTDILNKIVEESDNLLSYQQLFDILWKRLTDFHYLRHVSKSLIVIEFLLLNGKESFLKDISREGDIIRRLRQYKYFEDGKDIGGEVRRIASRIVQLLDDPELRRKQRSKSIRLPGRSNQWDNPDFAEIRDGENQRVLESEEHDPFVEFKQMKQKKKMKKPRKANKMNGENRETPSNSETSSVSEASIEQKKAASSKKLNRRKNVNKKHSKKGENSSEVDFNFDLSPKNVSIDSTRTNHLDDWMQEFIIEDSPKPSNAVMTIFEESGSQELGLFDKQLIDSNPAKESKVNKDLPTKVQSKEGNLLHCEKENDVDTWELAKSLYNLGNISDPAAKNIEQPSRANTAKLTLKSLQAAKAQSEPLHASNMPPPQGANIPGTSSSSMHYHYPYGVPYGYGYNMNPVSYNQQPPPYPYWQ